MRSEIQIQLAGLLLNVLFLPQLETPQCSVASPYHVFLEEHVFSIISAQRPLPGSLLTILCEPVNVETESRNFSDLEAQRVYRWQ